VFLDLLAGVHRRLKTPDADLSKGMRELKGVYSQPFKRTATDKA
jgi:hypothetical protein